jgi:hypothetical protein
MRPTNIAKIVKIVFVFWNSFFVRIALNNITIHAIESAAVIIPNMIVTRLLRKFWISAGLIPSDIKNCACSGLNTTYARNEPKTISPTQRMAPIKRKKSFGSIGFFGGSAGGGVEEVPQTTGVLFSGVTFPRLSSCPLSAVARIDCNNDPPPSCEDEGFVLFVEEFGVSVIH